MGSLGLPELALESNRQRKESRYLHSVCILYICIIYIYVCMYEQLFVKVCKGYDGSGSARVLAQPLACRAQFRIGT